MTDNLIPQFNARLDELLGLTLHSSTASNLPMNEAFGMANLLHEMDFDAELAPRAGIRSKWSQPVQRSSSKRHLPNPRLVWAFILILLLVLLAIFHRPVFAAVSRLFGYIYVSDIGFLPADSTRMIEQPVLQQYGGHSITVTRGVATPQNTILFLEFDAVAHPVDGARLETASGGVLEPLQWEYWPNTPSSRGVKIIFPPLPAGIMQTVLSLPDGWHLPLNWMSASQSKLPDVRVAPYISGTQQNAPSSNSCVERHGMKLCVLAATASAENTSVLVTSESGNPDLTAGGLMMGLTWQGGGNPIMLQDERGDTFPMIREQDRTRGIPPLPVSENATLTFPPLPAGQRVTLIVPALLATVDIPDQNIVVDVGNDPQPNTIIPLDANIQVLGTTLHFGKATLVGDGVNSLRLTLNADDPIPTADGITPASLELGKPDGVDDLYGSGMLAGSKDIFIELIRPGGKMTGMLTIPVIRADAIVEGPFEFTFDLMDASSSASTPVEANPDTFSPAPTPTSIPLDGYRYNGASLNPGDLLYTVLDGGMTNVFAYSPGAGAQSNLLVTLPGSISQIYVHPDYRGMDYLAGVATTRDGTFYIEDISLYSIRFDEPSPHLLYRFPPNPANTIGTVVEGDWSYDGRYAIFRYVQPLPGNDLWKFLWIDLSCRTSGGCVSHEISAGKDISFYKAHFAPSDYRILFTGADYSNTGKPDLFVMDFNPANAENKIVNITADSSSLADDVGVSPALWTPDGRIFTVCSDGQSSAMFCYVDPTDGKIDNGSKFSEHLYNYQLSPSGKYVLGIVINHNAPGKGLLEIHRFDLNGQAGPALVVGRLFPFAALSPSDQYIAYITENNDQLLMVDALTAATIEIYENGSQNVLMWLGWIR